MEIKLTEAQERRLAELARREGVSPEEHALQILVEYINDDECDGLVDLLQMTKRCL